MEKEMEVTVHVSVEPGDPHEWSVEEVVTIVTFVRSLGPAECFQSVGDQVLHLVVDDSVFFTLSLEELEGVCGHARVYALEEQVKTSVDNFRVSLNKTKQTKRLTLKTKTKSRTV